MLTVAGLTLPVLLPGQQTPATPVGQVQNLAHAVDSLEKTVPFYRDVIGLPVGASDPLAARPAVLNEDMSNVTGTQRAKFRAAVLRIPNAPFNLELTEFTGTTRKNFLPNLQDPGVATLVLQIRDLDQMFAKLRAANAAIVTAGGAPVKVSDNPNIKIRGLVVRDPDGLFIQLIQPDPLPASAANTADMVLGGSVNLSIDDAARTVTFLRDAIGFDAHPTAQLGTSAAATTLINLPGAQWRITHGSIAGTALDFGLIEYVGVPRAKAAPAAADPGSPAVTMVVQDIDAAVDRWKKAGGTVVSTGGKAVKLPNGAGNVFLRDINGLLWEFSVKEVLR
jgi:catechol 2,3-dioxygenase-like lactoylglutathione lyase family enzyme